VNLIGRILLLCGLSLVGIALLAPLAARSAPLPIAGLDLADRLLPGGPAPGVAVDRGSLSARQSTTLDAAASGAPERLDATALPTPASAPMEATLSSLATPPPPPPAPAPRRAVTYSGDSVWDDLAQCESGGNWSINTGNGYYGGLQFNYGTWHDYGGGEFAAYPHQASREEQIVVAERLRAVRGYAPWPACRSKLGLP
jgi:hypothetical protein